MKTGKSSAGKPEIGKSSAGGLRGNPACPRRVGGSAFRLDTDSAGRLTPPDSLSRFAPFPFAADP